MVPGSVGLWVGDQAILTNVHVPSKHGILGRLIRTEIENWRNSLFKKEDLAWYHDPELEPLDLENPRIKITFDQFVNRASYLNHKVIQD